MPQVDDLSRSLATFDQDATLTVVVEMSEASWLVAGMVPGVDRQPLKKLGPNPDALLRLVERWRDEAVMAGKRIERIALAFAGLRGGCRREGLRCTSSIRPVSRCRESIAGRRLTGWTRRC
jgi:transposase